MSASYSKPRRLNIVSLILLAALVAGLYSAWQFGPAYYRKWMAKEVLSEAANKVYNRRLLSGLAESEMLEAVRQDTVKQLHQQGIEDPSIQIVIDKQPQRVIVTANYQEVVEHPFVNKRTVLIFRPSSVAEAGVGE